MIKSKIFGEGDVTITFNSTSESMRVYVGTQEIEFVQNIKFNNDKQSTSFEITFIGSDDNTKFEEQIRSVKQQIPWAKVIIKDA